MRRGARLERVLEEDDRLMAAWIARRMGCTVTQVLAEPAWAIEAWLDAAAVEAALADREERNRARA